jgi:hypothetical protein
MPRGKVESTRLLATALRVIPLVESETKSTNSSREIAFV